MSAAPDTRAPGTASGPHSGAGQFMRFCVGGTLGFAVDVSVLYLTAGMLGWRIARLLSFMVAVTATWLFNRHVTFAAAGTRPATGAGLLGEYGRYVASMLGGAAVNYGAYLLVLHLYQGPAAPAAGVAVGSVSGLAVNFIAARWLVFRR